MLVAHVVGTALSAMLLRRGEDTLWTLAERIVIRAASVASAATPTPWRPSAVLTASMHTLRPLLLTHVIEERVRRPVSSEPSATAPTSQKVPITCHDTSRGCALRS